MTRGAHGALGVGPWGGLTRDVHNLWPDTGQFILGKNQDIWNNRQDFINYTPFKGKMWFIYMFKFQMEISIQ